MHLDANHVPEVFAPVLVRHLGPPLCNLLEKYMANNVVKAPKVMKHNVKISKKTSHHSTHAIANTHIHACDTIHVTNHVPSGRNSTTRWQTYRQ